jgi:hypothetical protein
MFLFFLSNGFYISLYFLLGFRAGRQVLLTHTTPSITFISVFTFTPVGSMYVETLSKAAAVVLTKGALIYVCIRE